MEQVLGFIGAIALVGIYLMPSIIADRKCKKQARAIAVVNIFLGWTIIGWFVALIWSVMED